MKSLTEIKKIINNIKPILKKEFNVENIFIFGSYARGDQTEESDLDLIVEIKGFIGLNIFDLEDFLEHKLGLKVGVLTSSVLKSKKANRIKRDLIHV
ncbi:MAG: nucleotidyltransferase domain-containing protein [Candidatus Helarchaeota archaeon]|nr:nucleotidyltransferase domain-containing protein [Candidatus Helarchaeota archaeon]